MTRMVLAALTTAFAAASATIWAAVPADAALESAGDVPVVAERYYACPSGYRFSSANDAAHCRKPERIERTSLNPCPNTGSVGLFPMVDYNGTRDMCAAQNPLAGAVAVERSCPVGFNKRIVRGTDQCEKHHAAEIVAPSVPVSR